MNDYSQTDEYENINKKIFRAPFQDQEFNNLAFYLHSIYEYVFNGHVAAEYPNTEFYVVDFNVPASNNDDDNITFVKCDILQKLPFPDDEFDYVFSRDKFLFFEKDNFYDYLSEALRILKPRGWLEVEYLFNHNITNGPVAMLIIDAWNSWFKSYNIVYDFLENFEKYLQETGKVESMSHQLVKVPSGCSNAFGEFTYELTLFVMKSTNDYLAPFMNISFEVFDNLVSIAESEMQAKDCDLSFKMKRILARKKISSSKDN
ncbi:S-adenosyl-L-methionine-dependent methyltransferase [Gigaspora margarita]|uniref:S-adenosyl-L-methionine-dependent methyltransferase n=1 Tax=Gigaspora margarita TaxID=4874 RepID=A0A8H4EVX1_GIGMA|nr:S-adenosyl-L-methionine-dependent methyltransferase [Gigaspora margarita]